MAGPVVSRPKGVPRRCLLAGAGAIVTTLSVLPRARASARVIDVTTVSGVDPTGASDSSAGFQSALSALQALGGGELYVPPGLYVISRPLTYAGASLSVVGCGQTLSVLRVTKPVTALSVALETTGNTITMRDIGFCPLMPRGGGTALSITGQNAVSGTQSCLIEDVDFCVAANGYTSFANALVLSAVQRGNVRNVNMHSDVGIVRGGSFATISNCVDVRFNNCAIDIVDTAFFVAGYCEGLHIVDTIVANANAAIATGSTPYSGDGANTALINLLGLYVAGCEFNCNQGSANLAYVSTGWISNTHFSTGNDQFPALALLGSSGVQVSNCEFTGQFNTAAPKNWVGITVASLNGWASVAMILDGCLFQNLGRGIWLQPGSYNTTALGLRMVSGPGLVGDPQTIGTYVVRAFDDTSGNASNVLQAAASQPGAFSRTDRLVYSRPHG